MHIYIYIYLYICSMCACRNLSDGLCSVRRSVDMFGAPSPCVGHAYVYICLYTSTCMHASTHEHTRTHAHTHTSVRARGDKAARAALRCQSLSADLSGGGRWLRGCESRRRLHARMRSRTRTRCRRPACTSPPAPRDALPFQERSVWVTESAAGCRQTAPNRVRTIVERTTGSQLTPK